MNPIYQGKVAKAVVFDPKDESKPPQPLDN
jgi:hypothetical protein